MFLWLADTRSSRYRFRKAVGVIVVGSIASMAATALEMDNASVSSKKPSGLQQDIACPPGVAPSRIAPMQRPPISLSAALTATAKPIQFTKPAQPGPARGSATESEALRRYVRGKQRVIDQQFARAADDIDAALRLDPNSTTLRAVRAEIAGASGDMPRAISGWEAVLAVDPTDQQALISLGIAAFESRQPAQCAALLGRAWPQLLAEKFASLSGAGRAAIGSALARSFYRLGFDEAGLEVAASALEVPTEQIASERGDGFDNAARSMAQLALESGEAALRAHRPDVAFMLFARSVQLIPDPRSIALAAYAQMLAGDQVGARATLSVMIEDAPWKDDERTTLCAWLLESLRGDAATRESLALAALDLMPVAHASQSDPESRARRARLMILAGDTAGGDDELNAAINAGASSAAALELAFSRLEAPAAVAMAQSVILANPQELRTVCRALVRSSGSLANLRSGLELLPAGNGREALVAGVLATLQISGEAWRRAEAAAENDLSLASLESMLVAAVSGADPALVARAASAAPLKLEENAAWHASLARAYAETGASIDAEQSLARAELLIASEVSPTPALRKVISDAHAAVDGRAPNGSPRARAESALAVGDLSTATAELMMARAIDADDATTLAMLLDVITRTDGPRAGSQWIARELARTPNDPLIWKASTLLALGMSDASAAMARIEARLAADPDDSLVLAWRELLLRAAGRTADAAAAARGRIASLPDGPRRSLEDAESQLQSNNPSASVEALTRFQEGAFSPPPSMRAGALEIAKRIPVAVPGRAAVIRQIARDAILTNPRTSLEFYAFEALGVVADPLTPQDEAIEAVSMIATEAASLDAFRATSDAWRSAADFLLSQGYPRAAGEFLRARLDDPSALSESDAIMLLRAAVACDAAAGNRAVDAMDLANRLRGIGLRTLGSTDQPGSEFANISGIFTTVGDTAGAELILESGLAVEPNDAVLLNNLGFARLERGAVDARTEQLLLQALQARPDDSGTLDSLGWLRYLQGRIADSVDGPGAVTLLERAITVGRPSALQHDHLGDARWRVGNRVGARESWTQAVRVSQAGVSRDENIAILREIFRREVGLAAINAARYHDTHDGAISLRAQGKLDAAARGEEPMITPSVPQTLPAVKPSAVPGTP